MLLAVGVDCIAQQVEQYLFEQDPVGVNRRKRIADLQLDAYLITRRLPIAQAYRFNRDIGNGQRLQTPRLFA
ncbi:hypothetical protein D3C84_944870 [compost metagenome]